LRLAHLTSDLDQSKKPIHFQTHICHSFRMADRRSGMVQSMGYPHSSSSVVSRAVAAAAANRRQSSMRAGRASKQYSVSAFYSMAAEQDVEVEDDLAQGLFQSICNNLPHTLSVY
jgi:hypothetical protein